MVKASTVRRGFVPFVLELAKSHVKNESAVCDGDAERYAEEERIFFDLFFFNRSKTEADFSKVKAKLPKEHVVDYDLIKTFKSKLTIH